MGSSLVRSKSASATTRRRSCWPGWLPQTKSRSAGPLPWRADFLILELMPAAIKAIDPAQNEFLAELEKKSGRENRFFRAMANRPEVLKAFVPFYASIAGKGSV